MRSGCSLSMRRASARGTASIAPLYSCSFQFLPMAARKAGCFSFGIWRQRSSRARLPSAVRASE
eukprot:6296887-Alexandrium_andersonii.AAC.1